MPSFGPLFILFVLIGFFSSTWLGLLTITFCIAVPATGLVLAIASASASPSLMAESFLGLWAGLIVATGIPYLVKRLFFGGPRRRRKADLPTDAPQEGLLSRPTTAQGRSCRTNQASSAR